MSNVMPPMCFTPEMQRAAWETFQYFDKHRGHHAHPEQTMECVWMAAYRAWLTHNAPPKNEDK